MDERDAARINSCYWWRCADGEMILIPRCWGCVIEGPGGCTCDVPGSELERARDGRIAAEREIERLREKLGRAADRQTDLAVQIGWMRREIGRLRTLLDRAGEAVIDGNGGERR